MKKSETKKNKKINTNKLKYCCPDRKNKTLCSKLNPDIKIDNNTHNHTKTKIKIKTKNLFTKYRFIKEINRLYIYCVNFFYLRNINSLIYLFFIVFLLSNCFTLEKILINIDKRFNLYFLAIL